MTITSHAQIERVEYIIPNWAVCPLMNSDESGITDEESKILEEFSQELLAEGIRAIPVDIQDVGFVVSNDVDLKAGDCSKALFDKL